MWRYSKANSGKQKCEFIRIGHRKLWVYNFLKANLIYENANDGYILEVIYWINKGWYSAPIDSKSKYIEEKVSSVT